jgi:hypothetical protein
MLNTMVICARIIERPFSKNFSKPMDVGMGEAKYKHAVEEKTRYYEEAEVEDLLPDVD